MKLSEHFSLEEFLKSETAERLKIKNEPPESVIQNLKELCERLLEPLREKLGHEIVILSGYRSKELNTAVGGVPNSQHREGKACDITVPSKTHQELFDVIKNEFDFDQLILEGVKKNNPQSGWVHVSWNGIKNRKSAFSL